MNNTQTDKVASTRGRVRISERNGWAAGVEGIALGYRPLYDTVKVGFVDADGNYTGEYTTVPRTMVEAVETATVEARETTLTVAGVERVIRTEMADRIRTVKQLEAAHTKAVKAAIVEMRRANLANLYRKADELKHARWYPLRDFDVQEVHNSIRRAERGTFPTHGTPGASTAPFPRVKFTEEIPTYLVEVEPGHYATYDAAEQLSLI